MALTIDNLLANILYGERIQQSLDVPKGGRNALYEYWNSNQSFKELLETAAIMQGKENPSKVKIKTIDLFVLQSLIPRIKYLASLPEEDPARKKLMKLTKKVPKAVKAAARNQEVAIQNQPVIEASPGFLERQWKKMTSFFHTSSDNIERLVDTFHPRTGEVGTIQEYSKELLKLLLYIIELFVDIIELLDLISSTERNEFSSDTYKNKFKLIIKIIIRTVKKIANTIHKIWIMPAGKVLLFTLLILFLNPVLGRFVLNTIIIGLKISFEFIRGADITELSERWRDLLEDVKDYFKSLAESLLIHLFKIFGADVEDWFARVIDERLQHTTEVLNQQISEGLSEATRELTHVAVTNTGEVVAAIHQGTVETTRTILPEIFKNRLQQAVLAGGAITASQAVGNLLEGMQTAESIPELKLAANRVNSLLDDILVKLKIDTLQQIQNSRELTPEQIEEIATTTVEKLQLSSANKEVITGTLNTLQQVLTNTGAQALMALPQIQQLIYPNRQRLLTNYGGKKTRRKHTKRNKTNKRNKNKKQNK